ncbi:MAG: SurA N-terminal domain-containing protein [Acidobacteriota bacterium]|nr:SurA N-terminal domain-containing protein [Acidobacteriota bacterium]
MQKARHSEQWAVGSGQKESRSVWIMFSLLLTSAACRLLLLFLLLTAYCTLLTPTARGQEVVDKMVATVNAGVLPECGEICLITQSDLLWQLALQPNTPLDNPSSTDLNRALHLLIDQRLILQEAEKLPAIAPTADEVKNARDELVKEFLRKASLSLPEFLQRLGKVGLTTVKLDQIVEQRLKIEKYLDFRFRNFVVITPKEIADYYRDIYVPRLRARAPGQIIPSLEQASGEIENILKEAKIESDTDTFLDNARERAEIVMLSPV